MSETSPTPAVPEIRERRLKNYCLLLAGAMAIIVLSLSQVWFTFGQTAVDIPDAAFNRHTVTVDGQSISGWKVADQPDAPLIGAMQTATKNPTVMRVPLVPLPPVPIAVAAATIAAGLAAIAMLIRSTIIAAVAALTGVLAMWLLSGLVKLNAPGGVSGAEGGTGPGVSMFSIGVIAIIGITVLGGYQVWTLNAAARAARKEQRKAAGEKSTVELWASRILGNVEGMAGRPASHS